VRNSTEAANARVAVDGGRLVRRLEELARIGARADGSCCRIALTPEDRAGRDLVVASMRELGLAVRIDRIGNVTGLRAGREDGAPVMTGSHVDTVATGGRYDGAYGVLAGLEVVAALNDAAIVTRRPLAVTIFTNEEGVRFQPDMMGSLVYAGGLPLEEALAAADRDGVTLRDALHESGYAGSEPCGAVRPHAFVELHVEQGPVLHRAGGVLGAVVDLQGISWQEVTIRGVSNHAGTTPMSMRRDAGYAAAEVTAFVRELTRALGGTQVGTVGALRLAPNLINVIPREAVLAVDLRNTDELLLREAERRLAAFLTAGDASLARREGVTIETRRLARFEPVHFDETIVAAIEAVAAELGQPIRRMVSGAGHDAQMMARIAPSAMIFVPSVDGISHNPAEHTDPAHLETGANALLHTLLRLAET
jgi:N-carbamoyl-L-amino-acid hydrolase